MPERILVTGANGQLGSALRALSAAAEEYDFVFVDRRDVDFADREAVERWFEPQTFDAIINCAAYTAVDRAEKEPAIAEAVNYRAVGVLAHLAKTRGASLIHVSTDYVFDGSNCKPYVENDPRNPQSVYGWSKYDGEEAVLAIDPPRSAIIRTSWVYSEVGNNFVKTMLRLGRERGELGVVSDQIGTPTYAGNLAQAILTILPQLHSGATEVYHYADEGVCSWYDFAKAIFELSGVDCRVNAIETKAYPTPAVRPHFSVLDKTKIKTQFGLQIPYWRDSLKTCLEQLGEKH